MDVVKGPDSSAEQIGQWITLYEKELLRLCFVYLKDEALAEDAVQETFLKAYSRLSSFRGDSSPKTWLIRIAINVCKDMSRTSWFRMIRRTVALDRLPPSQMDSTREIRSALTQGVMSLPRACREAVLLVHYEGFTQTQAAAALHISAASVNRRLKKAYMLLKSELEGGSHDD